MTALSYDSFNVLQTNGELNIS